MDLPIARTLNGHWVPRISETLEGALANSALRCCRQCSTDWCDSPFSSISLHFDMLDNGELGPLKAM